MRSEKEAVRSKELGVRSNETPVRDPRMSSQVKATLMDSLGSGLVDRLTLPACERMAVPTLGFRRPMADG